MDCKGRPSPKMKVRKRILNPIESHTRVEVTTKRDGLILIDPNPKLFTNEMGLVAVGVANVAQDKLFKVLVANFGATQVELCSLPAISNRLRTRQTLCN